MSDDRTSDRRDEVEDVDRPADLEAEFEALAGAVGASGRVPDFRAMMARAHAEALEDPDVVAIGSRRPTSGRTSEDARRDFTRFGRWIPAVAAAAVAGLLLFGGDRTNGDEEFDRLVADYAASAGGWQSPTASLMNIPGVDLGTVPSVGGSLLDIDLPHTNSDEGRDS